MNILCKLGFHKPKPRYVYVPRYGWEKALFGEFELKCYYCERCGRLEEISRLGDMEDCD